MKENVTEFPKKDKNVQIPTVMLGGRLWELRFGHKAMKLFCQKTRCNLATIDRVMVDYENQAFLIYCAISAQDRSVTEEQFDDWLDAIPLEDVFVLATEIISAALPDASERAEMEEAAEAQKEAAEENPTEENTSGTA